MDDAQVLLTIGQVAARTGLPVRTQLAAQLEAGTDARAERYWQLTGIING